MDYERNLDTLSQAIEKANAERLSFKLTLVGSGRAKADLTKFAMQTNGRIQVIGPVEQIIIPKILAQVHVGVLPFPDEEKFRVSSPIKLFEYMAAGLPIMATRIECHTNVIKNNNYVFWVNSPDIEGLCNALKQIWQHCNKLKSMGNIAASAAKSWTWHESAKKLKAALEYGISKNSEKIS